MIDLMDEMRQFQTILLEQPHRTEEVKLRLALMLKDVDLGPKVSAINKNPHTLSKAELLDAAKALITGDRNETHGDAHTQLSHIALLWNGYLRTDAFDAEKAAMMLLLVKLSRSCNGKFNPDDYIDLLGYGALAGECAIRKQAQGQPAPN